jgi:hypothetical protein
MEKEISTFNVIHWECNLSKFNKTAPLDIQTGVTGGWLNNTAILQIRWKVMCNVGKITALHLVAENNFTVPDMLSFDESKMKQLLLMSQKSLNDQLGLRTKHVGNIFVEGSFPESLICKYHQEFLHALNAS